MTLFLTSSPGGYNRDGDARVPGSMNAANGFVDQLKARWRENARVLFISASPDSFAHTDEQAGVFRDALPLSGLSISGVDICDSRNPDCEAERYDFIILGGGHVPTQNAFFQKIHLKEALRDFQGIVMGISAGTMNCASTVYAQPELEGEALDPGYRRFLSGLGLTDIMVLPHYQLIKDEVLDGLRLFADITYPDSMGRRFHVLVDGSYILVENGASTLYGEGYLVENGVLTQLCREGQSLRLL